MMIEDLQQGDVVYAAVTITNDGGVPGAAPEQVFATPGTRGMLLNIGHPEEAPEQTLYLVAFEDGDGDLGAPVGCLPDELTTTPNPVAE